MRRLSKSDDDEEVAVQKKVKLQTYSKGETNPSVEK